MIGLRDNYSDVIGLSDNYSDVIGSRDNYSDVIGSRDNYSDVIGLCDNYSDVIGQEMRGSQRCGYLFFTEKSSSELRVRRGPMSTFCFCAFLCIVPICIVHGLTGNKKMSILCKQASMISTKCFCFFARIL